MSEANPGIGPEHFDSEELPELPRAAHAANEPLEDEPDTDVELAEPADGSELDGLSDGG